MVAAYQQVVGEEPACRPRQVGHEVDDNIVDEYADGRERNVGQRIGYGYSSGAIKGIIGLNKRVS